MIDLYLAFPDRETACAVAAALMGFESVENFHCDGHWSNPETGETVYWVLDDIGTLYETTGEGEEATSSPLPGYHINGRWHSESPLPEALEAYRVFPLTPHRVFG